MIKELPPIMANSHRLWLGWVRLGVVWFGVARQGMGLALERGRVIFYAPNMLPKSVQLYDVGSLNVGVMEPYSR